MTYLKSFAMFESELVENTQDFTLDAINEAAVEAMAKVLPADLKKAGKKMTKEEAIAASTEIAKKLKLKVSDLTDTAKVVAAMAKQTMVMESEESEEDADLNEGINDWFKSLAAKKKKIGEWVSKSGLGAMAAGVITMALNAPPESVTDALRYNQTVEPNVWAIYGMAAIAVGFVAAIAGGKVSGTPVSSGASQVVQNQ
jgi:hypothetical protein